jgi:hypothetical protein
MPRGGARENLFSSGLSGGGGGMLRESVSSTGRGG